MPKIQLKRGKNINSAALTLSAGEPAFVTDTGKLYVGDGTNKILINPIDKPVRISTTLSYPKVQVNDYGQVISQSSLTATDIPNIATSQVTGLGTCATKNVGAAFGQIPTLDGTGKFPVSTIPNTVQENNLFAYYVGATQTVIPGGIIFLNSSIPRGSAIVLNADGTINLNNPGTYLINYSVCSNTADMATVLINPQSGGIWNGSFCRSSSSAITPYTTCSGILIRAIVASEKLALRNSGGNPLIFMGNYVSMAIVKIA